MCRNTRYPDNEEVRQGLLAYCTDFAKLEYFDQLEIAKSTRKHVLAQIAEAEEAAV